VKALERADRTQLADTAPAAAGRLQRSIRLPRNVIREAIFELGCMGLVRHIANRGATDAPLGRRNPPDLFGAQALEMLAAQQGQLTPEFVAEIDGSRPGIPGRLKRKDYRAAFHALNMAFPRYLFSACGNPISRGDDPQLSAEVHGARFYTSAETDRTLISARDERWAMIRAIENGSRRRLVTLCRSQWTVARYLLELRCGLFEQRAPPRGAIEAVFSQKLESPTLEVVATNAASAMRQPLPERDERAFAQNDNRKCTLSLIVRDRAETAFEAKPPRSTSGDHRRRSTCIAPRFPVAWRTGANGIAENASLICKDPQSGHVPLLSRGPLAEAFAPSRTWREYADRDELIDVDDEFPSALLSNDSRGPSVPRAPLAN